MAYENIIVDIEDNVCQIRLDRPEAMNALNLDLLRELGTALGEAQKNDKVRAIVITGSDKAFAAGADIKLMADKCFVEVFTADIADMRHRAETPHARDGDIEPTLAATDDFALDGHA